MSRPTRYPQDRPRAPPSDNSTTSSGDSRCPFLSRPYEQPKTSKECPFCAIASVFPPVRPSLISPEPSPNDNPWIFPQAHIVLSTENVLAFLDIQPSTKAHVLVCPRKHVAKVSDMRSWENLSVGAWLPIIARAVIKVAGVEDFNIVQNNGSFFLCTPIRSRSIVFWGPVGALRPGLSFGILGVNAAQVIFHVHYHIVPRPSIEQREAMDEGKAKHSYLRSRYGSGVGREDLDDEEGAATARDIRMAITQELEEMKKTEAGNGERKLLASL